MITTKEMKKRVSKRFKARTKVGEGPAPHHVPVEKYGDHGSYVEQGYRIWGFVNGYGRDRFCVDFNAESLS